jgi:hypothetical protein
MWWPISHMTLKKTQLLHNVSFPIETKFESVEKKMLTCEHISDKITSPWFRQLSRWITITTYITRKLYIKSQLITLYYQVQP